MPNAELLHTAKGIGLELGVSERTVRRYFGQGKLPGAHKLGGETSPIVISRKALDKLKKGRR